MIEWCEQPPDFSRKEIQDLFERLPFTSACVVGLGGVLRPKVIINQNVHLGIWAHLSERSVELGGLLIGNVYTVPDNQFGFVVSIEDFVRSDQYESTVVSLTMNSHVWDEARKNAKKGMTVIGWYHSHPNLGAFFSGTDRRTQSMFFHHDHCVGLVVDPIRKEEVWFLGGDSIDLSPHEVFVTPDSRSWASPIS